MEKLTDLNTVGEPLLWALGLMAPFSLHLKEGCEAVCPSRGPGIREVGQRFVQSKGHEQRSRQSWNARSGVGGMGKGLELNCGPWLGGGGGSLLS